MDACTHAYTLGVMLSTPVPSKQTVLTTLSSACDSSHSSSPPSVLLAPRALAFTTTCGTDNNNHLCVARLGHSHRLGLLTHVSSPTGLASCGPLRTILLAEHTDWAIRAVGSLVTSGTLSRRSSDGSEGGGGGSGGGAHYRMRCALVGVVAVLVLVLLDDPSAAHDGETPSHVVKSSQDNLPWAGGSGGGSSGGVGRTTGMVLLVSFNAHPMSSHHLADASLCFLSL